MIVLFPGAGLLYYSKKQGYTVSKNMTGAKNTPDFHQHSNCTANAIVYDLQIEK